jgi:purine-cytosine permease-like protein
MDASSGAALGASYRRRSQESLRTLLGTDPSPITIKLALFQTIGWSMVD